MCQLVYVAVSRGIQKGIYEPDEKMEVHYFSDVSEIWHGAVAHGLVMFRNHRIVFCCILFDAPNTCQTYL